MAGKAEKKGSDSVSERFWKGVAALGGAAAVFYALGFTVVQSYAYKNGFFGMFWLTKEFYRDAGATFILDLIRVPKNEKLGLLCSGKAGLSKRDWAKMLARWGSWF